MKRIIYLFIASLATICLASCTKKFEELNTDPTQFIKVTPESLIATAVKRTGDMIGANGLNSGINISMWEIANYAEPGARYTADDRNVWRDSYVNILENLVQVEKDYAADSAFNNRVQIVRIWKAYVYSILVGYFGPIPIAEANNLNNLNVVKFESEDTAYAKILVMLKEASDKIDLNKPNDKLTYDAIYGATANPLLSWKKFANTLRLKVALRCRRVLPGSANANIQELMANEANLIGAEAETAKVPYENIIGNENPYYKTYIRGVFTGAFPRMTDMMFMYLRSYKDPRINYYFDSVKLASRFRVTDTVSSTADDSLRVITYPIPHYGLVKSNTKLAGWLPTLAGGVDPQNQVNMPGINGNSAYSMVSMNILNNPARPIIILSFAEAQLLKAWAASLGLGGAQSAESYYNSGIDANFAFWGIPASLRDTYKAGNGVKFGTTGIGLWNYLHIVNANIPAGDINKIYHQLWLNYYPDQPFDAWCLQRQTRVCNFSPHTNPGFSAQVYQDIPSRGIYPSAVSTQNSVGYQGALQLLGINSISVETTNPYIDLKFAIPYTVPNYDAIPAYYDQSGMNKWYGNTIQSVRAAGTAIGFTVIVTRTYKP
ncbi:MAG: SusD/RagB family nutrient-binding outer membrane lipoprotein [Bacteroidetes bacterium]|nr:SusD/RagB family nutrient-binding outer membrane lipoprotein [Bacteroidota bacterium]